MVSHDLRLAAAWASKVLLLDGRGGWLEGGPELVFSEQSLTGIYGLDRAQAEVLRGSCGGALY